MYIICYIFAQLELIEIVAKERQGRRIDLEGSNIVAMPRSEKGYLLKRTFGSPVCGMTGHPLGQKNKKSGEDESTVRFASKPAGCFRHCYDISLPRCSRLLMIPLTTKSRGPSISNMRQWDHAILTFFIILVTSISVGELCLLLSRWSQRRNAWCRAQPIKITVKLSPFE